MAINDQEAILHDEGFADLTAGTRDEGLGNSHRIPKAARCILTGHFRAQILLAHTRSLSLCPAVALHRSAFVLQEFLICTAAVSTNATSASAI